MNFNNLDFVIDQRIVRITVSRPKALNALNREVLIELEQAFSQVAEDDAIAVAILTGSGPKAFVAGADIAAMQNLSPIEAREFASQGHRVMQLIEGCSKPVIAAVNGFALGGGCELAMGCDIRIAAEEARFGQPEINLGIIPGFGGSQRLSRLIGRGRALELILTGEMIEYAIGKTIVLGLIGILGCLGNGHVYAILLTRVDEGTYVFGKAASTISNSCKQETLADT